MTDIAFYHLVRRGVDETLPALLEKIQDRGLRAVVLAGSPERVEALDSLLWTYRGDSFLPHGARRDGYAAEQPIYLTETEENPNDAGVLVVLDGASPEFVASFSRCLDLFDGNDPAALAGARMRWKAAKAAGHELTYWQQGEGGQWRQKNGG